MVPILCGFILNYIEFKNLIVLVSKMENKNIEKLI